LFLLGYSIKNLDFRGFIFLLLFFCFNIAAQLIHEVIDYKEDRKNRIITTVVVLEEEKIKKICYISLWFAFLISCYLFYLKFVNSFFIVITFSFVLFFTYRITKKTIDKKLRREYKTLGLMTGFIYFLLIFWS
jgi:4-hydroxybenzoate polyprenyltransferase